MKKEIDVEKEFPAIYQAVIAEEERRRQAEARQSNMAAHAQPMLEQASQPSYAMYAQSTQQQAYQPFMAGYTQPTQAAQPAVAMPPHLMQAHALQPVAAVPTQTLQMPTTEQLQAILAIAAISQQQAIAPSPAQIASWTNELAERNRAQAANSEYMSHVMQPSQQYEDQGRKRVRANEHDTQGNDPSKRQKWDHDKMRGNSVSFE